MCVCVCDDIRSFMGHKTGLSRFIVHVIWKRWPQHETVVLLFTLWPLARPDCFFPVFLCAQHWARWVLATTKKRPKQCSRRPKQSLPRNDEAAQDLKTLAFQKRSCYGSNRNCLKRQGCAKFKFQAIVYDVLSPAIAITGYAIGL